ncbi:hypothetical protein J3Q64DRAFT_1873606 [Phycomyces blakesleeanus]|uniref:COP9 signalosome complex subunit 3 n=1 Tax=Phycomyces blakesleeanus TaxID=4837 RepID=A0ABR3AN51_PHYBL
MIGHLELRYIGMMHINLSTARCCAATSENAQQLFELLSHFISVFDVQQVLGAPARIEFIAKALDTLANGLKRPLLPIQPLADAIQRLNPELNTLTTLHAPLVKACLISKMYKYPLSILDSDIDHVDPTAMTIVDFLEYHYDASLIYIGNKQFERALDFLSIASIITILYHFAISAPANIPSAIQFEAYKKYCLVSLIQDGKIRILPKYTATVVDKGFKLQYEHYITIAKAYEQTNISKFDELILSFKGTLEQDQNFGLAKQCAVALRLKKIKALTKVYKKVDIQDIAVKLDPKGKITPFQVEQMVVRMINTDQISATILHVVTDGTSRKMVSFHDIDNSRLPNTTQHLQAEWKRVAAVSERTAKIDKEKGLDKAFQSKFMVLSVHGGQSTSMQYEEDIDLPLSKEGKLSVI